MKPLRYYSTDSTRRLRSACRGRPMRIRRAARRWALACLVGTAFATTQPRTVRAAEDAGPTAEVAALYDRGKSALATGDAESALRHFRACLAGVQGDEPNTWQMLLAVALAYERLHRDAAAIEYYEVFLERSRPHEAALSEKWRRRQEYVRRTVE